MGHILGLTGGIASGKSTVSQLLKEQGIPVVDADLGAREVMKPEMPAMKKIEKVFGSDVLLEDGSLNREALAQQIFHSQKKRELLNQCVEKEIREWITDKRDELLHEGFEWIVLDIPLLFEAGYDQEVDEIMVVSVSKETQLNRLMKRNQLSEEEAKARIEAQMPLEEKEKRASIVINNNGSIEQTKEQVLRWLDEKNYRLH
jgi:dephospho-CoA kinase